jgi:hypothetical protein
MPRSLAQCALPEWVIISQDLLGDRTAQFYVSLTVSPSEKRRNILLIDIKAPSSHQVKRISTLFALQQDNWNDYRFQTL